MNFRTCSFRISILVFALFFRLPGDNQPLAAQDGTSPRPAKLTGVLPPTSEDQKQLARLPAIDSVDSLRLFNRNAALASDLPSRVINIDHLPRVGRQSYGSCVSWAMVYYYKTWQEAKENGWVRPDPAINPEHVMSPAYVFNLANGGHANSGTGEWTSLDYLLKYGACSCAEMEANADPYDWPDESQMLAAFPHRAQAAATIDLNAAGGLDALKAHLAAGDLATFSMVLYENFSFYPTLEEGVDNEVLYQDWGRTHSEILDMAISSNHELCVIGYDDNRTYVDGEGQPRQGAVLVVNSWGTTWGVNFPEAGEAGFIWLGYDYFIGKAGSVFIMTDRIGYQPTLVGSFHVQHGRRLEISLQLLGGDRAAPDWEMEIFPRTGGDRPIDHTLAFDATDFANADDLSWWLRGADSDITLFQPNQTGFITSFKIKRLDGILWESPDAPVQTVETNKVYKYAWLNAASLYRRDDVFPAIRPGIGTHVLGDLDNDGDYDLIYYEIGGATYPWTYSIHCHRNDGNNVYTEIDSGLPIMEGPRALGDFDRDGLPDLACSGYDETEDLHITRIFHNDGDCRFTDTGLSLPNATGNLEWIDYNNDARLDLAINEYDGTASVFTGLKVLINNGDGTFAKFDTGIPRAEVNAWADFNRDGRIDVAAADSDDHLTSIYLQSIDGSMTLSDSIPGTRYGSVAAGDVDNDGWLDLAVAYTGGSAQPHKGEVWRNQGNGTFALYGSFPGAVGGSIAWGDVDNDGLADLAVCGDFGGAPQSEVNVFTRVYRNNGDGTFKNLGFNLAGVGFLTQWGLDYLQWMDYDLDSDLDLIVGGRGARTDGYPGVFHLYENRAAQTGGLNRPNSPPSTPPNPVAAQEGAGRITLSWDASSDVETPSGGLYYDVRAGRMPEWGDVIPPDTTIPLWGNRLRPSLAAGQLGLTINPPPSRPFYWSVRAIDAAQGRSPWSAPQLFVPQGSQVPGDTNADGRLDVADVLMAARMAAGAATPNLARADRNDDGVINFVDLVHTRSQILAKPGPDKQVVAGQWIGPAGGSIDTGDLRIDFPPWCFDGDHEIWIQRNEKDRPFETSVSAMYRIDGLPPSLNQPIVIRIKGDAGSINSPMMAVGEFNQPSSSDSMRRGFRMLPATAEGNGVWRATLNPGAGAAARDTAQPPTGSLKGYTVGLYTGLLSDYGVWANTRFSIEFPSSLDFAHVIELSNALEAAHDSFEKVYGFSYGKRKNWPVHVSIYTMDSSGTYGEFIASKLGDNYGWIEFNTTNIANYPAVRSTAYHEFFHLVQNLYDPRSGFIKAVSAGEALWLAEAASVWAEEIPSPPDFTSPVFDDNFLAPFKGLVKTGSHKVVQEHGYGLASLIKYLVNVKKTTAPKAIYTDILAGTSSIDAIRKNGPTGTDFSWWGDYMAALVAGQCYQLGTGQYAIAAPEQRQFKIDDTGDFFRSLRYSEQMSDLAGQLYMAIPQVAGFDADHRLSCRLNQLPGDTHRLFLFKSKAGEPTTMIGEATPANGALKIDIPGLDAMQSEGGWKLLALAANDRAIAPYTGKTLAEFTWAVTQHQTKALPTGRVSNYFDGFPEFDCQGTFTGGGWADWWAQDLGVFNQVNVTVPGVPPLNYELTYTATPVATSVTSPPDGKGEYVVQTFDGIKKYTMSFQEDNADVAWTEIDSDDGHFTFDMDADDELVLVGVKIVYDMTTTRYNAGGEVLSTYTFVDNEWPILIMILMP